MASFHIETDRPAYLAGETVTGRLLLLVPATISNTQGLTLRFTALESLKKLHQLETQPPSSQQLNPAHSPQQPNFSLDQVLRLDQLEVSSCHSQQENNQQLRPKYLKTPENKYYQLSHSQKRNQFSKTSIEIIPPGTITAGQYCFPFSINTFQNWPASFTHHQPDQHAQIQYHLTASLLPISSRHNFTITKPIIILDPLSSQIPLHFELPVTSFYCIKKGTTHCILSLDKQGYQPGQTAQVILSVDNTQSQADLEGAHLSIKQSTTYKWNEDSQPLSDIVLQKQINFFVPAGGSAIDDKSIKESLVISPLMPSTRGSLISSSYCLELTLKHKALLHRNPAQTIPLVVYPQVAHQQIPHQMKNNWKPKMMGTAKLQTPNNFKDNNPQDLQKTLK